MSCDYVARGSVLLDGYIDNLRLEQLGSMETEYSTIISDVMPLETGLRKTPRTPREGIMVNKIEKDPEPINRDENGQSNTEYNELVEGLRIYADSLAKLLVSPNDGGTKSILESISNKNNGILSEISSLTQCLLDTWVEPFQQNMPSNTYENISAEMVRMTRESQSPRATDENTAKLIEENKELKRKITFYKSQISKLCTGESALK